ncbi:multiubiquitin domain-containing protein [Roseibium aggregatum]|uniref:Multiubiquitin domain-containing protein n=1 Tax=Roseibium aggregatum TaxID=187304 RepID=A0A939EJ93_9HYPH|nr:multiubiquitin domain-containing protein [Roseibium aggregatum]MBN9673731.1 multiubiquitin domain-containing protein [Roseibium aggregatum]
MTAPNKDCSHDRGNVRIEIADTDLIFREIELDTDTPTGGKISKAAGFSVDERAFVLQWMNDGDFESLRVQEEADLEKGTKFIVTQADSSNRIAIDGNEVDWPDDNISSATVRKLGKIPDEKQLFIERSEEPDRRLKDGDVIKIGKHGIEVFKSREPKAWLLNVQGKRIKSETPTIPVVEALTRAGFDPNAWIIILKVQGQPKRQLDVNDTIDLSAPGIEKVRLTPKDVGNGDARPSLRRDFALLEADESFLGELGLLWETKEITGQHWLIIYDYPVPEGYSLTTVTLSLLVPPTYPKAEIDMFFVYPPLDKATGGNIPATETRRSIDGLPFQQWSRHRGPGSRWHPCRDNVMTHLALVEAALNKEVDQ